MSTIPVTPSRRAPPSTPQSSPLEQCLHQIDSMVNSLFSGVSPSSPVKGGDEDTAPTEARVDIRDKLVNALLGIAQGVDDASVPVSQERSAVAATGACVDDVSEAIASTSETEEQEVEEYESTSEEPQSGVSEKDVQCASPVVTKLGQTAPGALSKYLMPILSSGHLTEPFAELLNLKVPPSGNENPYRSAAIDVRLLASPAMKRKHFASDDSESPPLALYEHLHQDLTVDFFRPVTVKRSDGTLVDDVEIVNPQIAYDLEDIDLWNGVLWRRECRAEEEIVCVGAKRRRLRGGTWKPLCPVCYDWYPQ